MKKVSIYLGFALLLTIGSANLYAQGRVSKTVPTGIKKTDNVSTSTRASRNIGNSNNSGSGLSISTKKTSGTGTNVSGTSNNSNGSNVIHVNTYTRADGKKSAVYGTSVTQKNGKRHVTGNSASTSDKAGKGHIVKDKEGKTVYHRTMNGRVIIDKKG